MKKNRKIKGKSRKVWGVILIVIGCLHFIALPFLIIAARTDPFKMGGSDILGGVMSFFVGIPLFILGIHLLRTADWDEIWETTDSAKAPKLIRRMRRIKDDDTLLELGRAVKLKEVADAAFKMVKDQSSLGEFVRRNYGSADRIGLALSHLKDEDELMEVVKKHSFSITNRKISQQALRQMKDISHITELAKDVGIYEELRVQAYQMLQSAGLEGDRMLAEDATISPGFRAEACDRLGLKEQAQELHRQADQKRLFQKEFTSNIRLDAGRRILASCDETWIEANIKKALQLSYKGDSTIREFLVAAAQKSPDLLKKMWPQVRRWAHSDEVKHSDGHFDHSHSDHVSKGGYDYGKHYDFANSSDCTHSDVQNQNIHSDDPGNYYLSKFPPYIAE